MEFLLFIIVVSIIGVFVNIYSHINKLHNKTEQLEWDSTQLSKRLDKIRSAAVNEAPDKPEQCNQPESIPPVPSLDSLPAESETVDRGMSPLSTALQTEEQGEERQPGSRTREEWESFVGGKLLNRIGALALIIGLGFFLKYAFDNNWISETVRVLIGAFAGIASLGLAYRTHQKGFQIFSQGLVGAGIAILYLSVYASFNFYVLVPQWAAFLLMAVVTALSLALGTYYDSIAIGLLGWAGGFLTPLMLSTGSANEIGLFTYIALLDTGLLAVVFMKNKWNVIEPLTLAATWIMYFAWYYRYYQDSDLIVTVFFISVFWILFFGLDVAHLRLTNADSSIMQHIDAAFNSVLYYAVMYALINPDYHPWMSGLTVAFAGIYIGTFWWLKLQAVPSEIVIIRYVLTAIALAVAAIAIQFEGFRTVIGWSVGAAGLLWASLQWKKQFVLYSALALFLFAAIKLIFTDGAFEFVPLDSFRLVFNERCFAFIVLSLTVGFAAYRIPRFGLEKASLTNILHFAWCAVLFAVVTVETSDFFRYKLLLLGSNQTESLLFLRPMILSMVWAALSMPLLWIGSRQNLEPLLISSICLLTGAAGALLTGLQFAPIAEFVPFWNMRAAAFTLTIFGVLLHYRRLGRTPSEISWIESFSSLLLYVFAVLLFTLITVELNDFFRRQIMDQAGDIRDMFVYSRIMALAVVWAALSLLLAWIGLKKDVPELSYASLGILMLSICYVIVRGIHYVPITSFHIIMNTRFASGLFLLAVMFIQQHFFSSLFRGTEWKEISHRLFQIGIIVLSLVLLTGETRDYFERQIASTQATDGTIRHLNNLEQLSLSSAWLLYSLLLMFLGFWRAQRNIRIIAFILFGFTILKIFIYDLSSLETLYRIFSFIGLGVILLAVSYAYQRYKDMIF
jgi:uncharacterized membrane protein